MHIQGVEQKLISQIDLQDTKDEQSTEQIQTKIEANLQRKVYILVG